MILLKAHHPVTVLHLHSDTHLMAMLSQESQKYECLQDWVQHVKQMVRPKVNSLRKTVESQRQGILELNSVNECLKEL